MKFKKAELPFNWIFAIVAGGVIIFLALFFVTGYVNTAQYKYDTEIANKLSILLDPLETSFAGSSVEIIKMPSETRINLKCKYEGIGRQELSVSTKKSIGDQWQEFSAPQSIHNKYIFSKGIEQGKELYIFSKQFRMPFDVSDLIYVTASNYCFVSPPERISDEIKDLNATHMQLAERKQECKKNSKSICFGNTGCNISVYGLCYDFGCSDLYDYGFIQQGEDKSYFDGDALMYAAIFSSSDLYNCNVKRLMNRISLISRVYTEKSRLLDARGCMTGDVASKLLDLSYESLRLVSSANIMQLRDKAKEVENANEAIICKVW